MIEIKELTLILNSIPTLLQYFVPGYWTIFIFKYFCSKKMSSQMNTIMSCVVSYILISMVVFLRSLIEQLSFIPDTAIINSGIAILLGTILSIILSILFSSKRFSNITVALFHKTPNENIWRDILDLKAGSNLKVYLKNEDYYVIGHHKNQEENGDSSWIALSAFAKFDKETNENYRNEPSFLDDESVTFVVRLSDIEHIEIF